MQTVAERQLFQLFRKMYQCAEELPALASRRELTFLATGVALLMLLVLQADTNPRRGGQRHINVSVGGSHTRSHSIAPHTPQTHASSGKPPFNADAAVPSHPGHVETGASSQSSSDANVRTAIAEMERLRPVLLDSAVPTL